MIEGILWALFIFACLLICGLVLLQEGKGGGLGDAFGGAGAQTFGVKAQGVAKVTGYLVAFLMLIAIGITKIRTNESSVAGQLLADPPAGVQPGEVDPSGAEGAGDAGAGEPDAGSDGGDDGGK